MSALFPNSKRFHFNSFASVHCRSAVEEFRDERADRENQKFRRTNIGPGQWVHVLRMWR